MSETSLDNTPPDISEAAKDISNNLLLEKSRKLYEKTYQDFINWKLAKHRMWWLRPCRNLVRVGVRWSGHFHDPLDHVTGIEKRELLAHLAGDCDPFRMMAIKKGPGTRERPNLIPSAFSSRLICCSCSPMDNHLEYMWLHQREPKRCGCGFWFELCPIAPL